MRYDTLGFLTALVLVFSAGEALAEEARWGSRMDLYEAQARRYVADRTMTVTPRVRYVEPRVTFVDVRPTRQRIVEDTQGRVGVVRNASYHAPAETTIVTQEIVDRDLDRVGDGYDDDSRVVVSRAYTSAPQAYAGYNSYNSYAGQRSYATTYVDSSYSSHYVRPAHTTVYYSSDYHYPTYYHRAHYRPYCGPNYGVYYRSGWRHHHGHHGHWGHRGHWGHHRGHHRGHHGSHWGVSVHFRF